MELSVVLENRHSCRKYLNEPVPSQMIWSILEAGRSAPYASGGPRRELLYVCEKETKAELMKACCGQPYVEQAGVVFIICGTDTTVKLRSGFPKFVHDCDAAAMCMILRAVDLGLGTCWIGHFQPKVVRHVIKCTSRPTVVLLVGWPA